MALKYVLNEIDEREASGNGLPIDLLEISKWGKNDMRVKMYLLGIYFEKFFCPVHIDIIRSCVEDTTSYKIGVKFGCISSII